MKHTNHAVRVGGTCLAFASSLMIAALAFHGPIDPNFDIQMTRVADAGIRWSIVHWLAAAGLSLFAAGGIIILNSRSRLTDGLWTITAWAVLIVGAFWTMITAVAETTVVTNAALGGSIETFRAWWSFSEGMANGFAFLALAVAVIALNEARSPEGFTPSLPAWIGTIAGIASFFGWVTGMWFEIRPGNLLWVLASIVMSGWMLWFGAGLMRSHVPVTEDRRAPIAEPRKHSAFS